MPRPTPRKSMQTIAGIERSMEVLSLFAADGVKDLGVTEIATELGISKAVVHRVLSSFKTAGLLEIDETTRRYRLGLRTLRFALAYLDSVEGLDVARAHLDGLVDRTGETATVSARAGDRRVYVAQAVPPRDIRMEVRIGSSHSLHAGASSKVLLAFMPEADQERYLRSGALEAVTAKTVTSPDLLRQELRRIRADGFCVSLGERRHGAGSVAAPIVDGDGQPLLVLSLCGPADRFATEVVDCTEAVVDTARRISRSLALGQLPDDATVA